MSFQNELWDKPNSIITFNDTNNNLLDKLQKFVGDTCKLQSINIINHKRIFEKFLLENDDLKKSQFSFNNNIYNFIEKLYEILNIQETFNEMLLKEAVEIVKDKTLALKKDTKNWKNHKRKIYEEFTKESQKRDTEFKRYCSRYNLKETAHIAYLKAEENKSLSRNQVDNFHKLYLTRQSEYDQSKADYITVLDNFNKFQSNHYSVSLLEWSLKAEEIENTRYGILKSTFTNFLELCRSVASKFNEIADKIEQECDSIDCVKDCSTLVNQEKSGEIPPGPIAFKDFEVEQNVEAPTSVEIRNAKVSSSSSESNSISNGKGKDSVLETKRKTSSISNCNSALNTSISSNTSNGTSGSSKIFSKFFGGIKKTKSKIYYTIRRVEKPMLNQESSNKSVQNEIESLEALLEEKLSLYASYDFNESDDKEIDDIKNKIESLKNELAGSKKDSSQRKNPLFRTSRPSSRNKSIDSSANSMSKDTSCIGRSDCENSLNKPGNRRSQSVSSIHRSSKDISDIYESGPQSLMMQNTKSIFTSALKSRNSKERKETSSIYAKSIEVIRTDGPVEIVSTPAEAMASANRTNSEYISEYEISQTVNDESHEKCLIEAAEDLSGQSKPYCYYYIGSCVAIHEYTTCDPSNIYLSFNAGEQFYIIQEDTNCNSNGWLFVERTDKSAFGYVPESYMHTKNYDAPVIMFSEQPRIVT